MTMAITEGLALQPAPFGGGLAAWSSGDGLAGSPNLVGDSGAAVVTGDSDFGTCLELSKTQATQRLRYRVRTPYRVGMYLRVRVRLKVLAGSLPQARLSCQAVTGAGAAIAGLAVTGPEQAVTGYGQILTLEAILGSGARGGVDLVWGTAPAGAHLGVELTGPVGAIVRIADFEVEDISHIYHRAQIGGVDVRDYGALGDTSTNDHAAFVAADAAAKAAGTHLIVPDGDYLIGANLSLSVPARFEGRVRMAAGHRLALTRNFDLEAYASAFGTEAEGFRRGLQALFHATDHITFDLKGRSVEVEAPIDVAALAGMEGNSYAHRRQIMNGQLVPKSGTVWDPDPVTSQGSYSTSAPYRLSNLAKIDQIEVGSLVTGAGVARETYVRSKNVAAGTVELSLPPGSQGGTRNYTFTRFRYLLDFSGFGRLDRFEMLDIEFLCGGAASAVMLPVWGITTRFQGCVFNRPRDRAITSTGTGCQGMMIDECQFLSDEQGTRVQDRTTVAFNANANDVKVRDNRAVRFRHFGVLHGSGHMFVGNHWFQGDSESPGVRSAGLVLTGINIKTLITGNYVDNSFVELTNEREPDPQWSSQFSFGGLTVTGNIFTANDVVSSFAWLVVTPRGSGHYLQGLSISDNTFRTLNGAVDRVDKVDTTYADLDYTRFRNITVHGNNFNGISTGFYNPVTVLHTQNSAASAWTVESDGAIAFGGRARVVTAVVPSGTLQGPSGARHDLPGVQSAQGVKGDTVTLRWPVAMTGAVWVTLRADNPS